MIPESGPEYVAMLNAVALALVESYDGYLKLSDRYRMADAILDALRDLNNEN